jgi:hypothetical protein
LANKWKNPKTHLIAMESKNGNFLKKENLRNTKIRGKNILLKLVWLINGKFQEHI